MDMRLLRECALSFHPSAAERRSNWWHREGSGGTPGRTRLPSVHLLRRHVEQHAELEHNVAEPLLRMRLRWEEVQLSKVTSFDIMQ